MTVVFGPLLSDTTLVLCTAVALFCLLRWQSAPWDRERTELLMVAAMLALPMESISYWVAIALGRIRCARYDLYIYEIDRMFGAPSFPLGRMLLRHPYFKRTVDIAYSGLPFAMLVVSMLYVWLKPRCEAVRVVVTFAVNLAAAVPIYLAVPVSGPAFAFPDFPALPRAVLPHKLYLAAVPNGVPSVHFSTALLVWVFLSEWTAGWSFGLVFTVLTFCATVGGGEHYLFDLLCALPYTVAVYLLGGWCVARLRPQSVAESLDEEPLLEPV